jgi:hypothetical protein
VDRHDRRLALYTYFIWCDASRLVKIGKTTNIAQRLSALRTAAAVRLVGLVKGDIERTLHRVFSSQKVRREWFRPDLGVLRRIASCDPVRGQSSEDVEEMMGARRSMFEVLGVSMSLPLGRRHAHSMRSTVICSTCVPNYTDAFGFSFTQRRSKGPA